MVISVGVKVSPDSTYMMFYAVSSILDGGLEPGQHGNKFDKSYRRRFLVIHRWMNHGVPVWSLMVTYVFGPGGSLL